MKNNYKVLGIMSGTSMDGLDLAYCEFTKNDNGWKYKVRKASVIRYSKAWINRLNGAPDMSASDFVALDFEYGKFLGNQCRAFVKENKLRPDFIASHGHTIFHQPQKGFTAQIGNGNAIYATTGLPVVYDFRSLDVQLGGEGAPLVPVGDKFLFAEFDICLNLGGIANLSSDISGERKAFDICFCNMALNYLMEGVGKKYDKGGNLASGGTVDNKMLGDLLKKYSLFRKRRPSLGREIFVDHFKPILDNKKISLADKLTTAVESSAMEIASAAIGTEGKSMLCTGGGVFNSYLMSRILYHCGDELSIIVPEDEIIKYKEALVFAFLGVMRVTNNINSLKSVTGAERDSSGGVMVGFENAAL